jgi:hypothetical protein
VIDRQPFHWWAVLFLPPLDEWDCIAPALAKLNAVFEMGRRLGVGAQHSRPVRHLGAAAASPVAPAVGGTKASFRTVKPPRAEEMPLKPRLFGKRKRV